MSRLTGSMRAISIGARFVAALAAMSHLVPANAADSMDIHRLVARLAEQLISPATTRAVGDLLGTSDLESVWVRLDAPDLSGSNERRHYVLIPVGVDAYDRARDCRPTDHGDCLVGALNDAYRAFMLPASLTTSTDLRDDVGRLILYMGDLAQPLNSADNHDRSGRDVRVVEEGTAGPGQLSDLYRLWDASLLQRRRLTEDEYLRFLAGDLAAHPARVSPINFVAWAEEAHAVAERYAYDYEGFTAGAPPAVAVKIPATDVALAGVALERQIEVSGARLAHILDTVLAK
jgi:hypothetical protein